jgi:hypothetical protein
LKHHRERRDSKFKIQNSKEFFRRECGRFDGFHHVDAEGMERMMRGGEERELTTTGTTDTKRDGRGTEIPNSRFQIQD